jgi:Ferredoxin thioredoxin reductase variable alpha chain
MVTAVEEVRKMMEVGTRVRVVASVVVYNHPEHRNQPFDMNGQEGEIVALATEFQGKPISANFPYVVKFSPKHKLHLGDHEIGAI